MKKELLPTLIMILIISSATLIFFGLNPEKGSNEFKINSEESKINSEESNLIDVNKIYSKKKGYNITEIITFKIDGEECISVTAGSLNGTGNSLECFNVIDKKEYSKPEDPYVEELYREAKGYNSKSIITFNALGKKCISITSNSLKGTGNSLKCFEK